MRADFDVILRRYPDGTCTWHFKQPPVLAVGNRADLASLSYQVKDYFMRDSPKSIVYVFLLVQHLGEGFDSLPKYTTNSLASPFEAQKSETRVCLPPFQHPDGFCNWPSKYTTHSVAASPFRGGKGDVVREVSDAAKEQGIGFGLYLAPWDKHERTYGNTRLYNEFYMGQLTELMTQ
jgi:hypothetical protein